MGAHAQTSWSISEPNMAKPVVVVHHSGGEGTANTKSHHNVGGLPDDLQFTLVEPLRRLFKDEARSAGAEVGLPEEMVWRQPSPGPGLAIRIIGEVTPERLAVLRQADSAFDHVAENLSDTPIDASEQ